MLKIRINFLIGFLVYINFNQSVIAQQDGSIDLSFGQNGIVIEDLFNQGLEDRSMDMVVLPNDKILLSGFVKNPQVLGMSFGLCMFNPNGSIDTTFGNNGIATTSVGGNDYLRSMLIQPDSKIVVAGYTYQFGYDMSAARFNSNGILDTTFNGTGKLNAFGGFLYKVLLDSSNNVLLVGHSGHFVVGTTDDIYIKRYDSFGKIDSSFGLNGVVKDDLGDVEQIFTGAIQPDGKILVAGVKWNDALVARYLDNGTLDSTFNNVGYIEQNFGTSYDRIYDLKLLSNGKIVVTGSVTDTSLSTGTALVVARFENDGKIDSTFGNNGYLIDDFGGVSIGHALSIQNDGKILVTGYGGPTEDFVAARYYSNGVIDSSFGSNGKVIIDLGAKEVCRGIAMQSTGKIIVSGSTDVVNGSLPDFTMIRLNNLMTSITEINDHTITIYPNPTREFIRWRSKHIINSISIFDSYGNLINELFNLSANRIDLSSYPSGLYIMQFKTKNQLTTKKFLKF